MIRADRARGTLVRLVLVGTSLLAFVSCEDASAPGNTTLPAFIYVADTAGYPSLVRFRNDSAVVLTVGSKNTEPRSASGRVVFTSERDGYPQVYIADLDILTPHRVMTSLSFDRTPDLSPSADSIVFVSTRTGVPRLFLIRAPALNQAGEDSAVALATGAADYTPEDGPAWSPGGGHIAFTSVRGGNSQVYLVASGGGAAVPLTSESGGAFQPTWSADGNSIYYIAATPGYSLRVVSAAGGTPRTVVSDSFFVAGPAACNASYCVYSTGFGLPAGSMSSIALQSEDIQVLFPRTAANERQPAILVP